MKRLGILAAIVLLASVPAAADVIVNFDELPTPFTGSGVPSWGNVPAEYRGFGWTGFEVVDGPSFRSVYGTGLLFPSGERAVYNGGNGYRVVTTTGDPFSFVGAAFSGWPNVGSYTSTSVTVNGYLGGVLVDTAQLALRTDAFLWLQAGFDRVDRVDVVSSAAVGSEYRYWLMDNFTYQSVPEPTTLLLLGAGLAGMSVAGRRRRR